jgi:carbon-monoxide dehydrogenase medium subunit
VKNAPFDYHAPRTLDEVLALLAEHGDEAKVLAGGQSLVPLLAMRLARPSQLVDINEVAELAGIRPVDGTGVAFGTLTRERDAERSPLVAEHLPLLAEALPLIGHVSIRNRGTVGGSMAHADASAELPAVALATGAEMVVRSARGERVVAAEDFFVSHFTTALDDDELLTEVRMPSGPAGAGWAFHEIARRHGDFALVGVAAMVVLERDRICDARVTLMGVADRPVRAGAAEAALVGQPVDDDTTAAAAYEATKDLDPASDMHGSAEFRRHLAGVAVRRALTTAASRAGGAS